MKYFADLHLHSKYSRAVSKNMTIPTLAEWGKKKGVSLLATSDFTHPEWFAHLKEDLIDDGTGFYKSKSVSDSSTRFVLGTEISCIYSQGGKTRRVHILVIAPDLGTVEKINSTLGKRGNLKSDGRPILGMSAHDLAQLVLEVNPNCLIIPAHAWTPWFSLYGSNSGFDSIDECFGELSKNIYGIETGLSSDPLMNWRLKELDNKAVLSFSDAHSPAKMGREATIFEGEFSYAGLVNSIKNANTGGVAGTIEFFPEEGKYHYTGHRDCGVKHTPEQTRKEGETCPVCGRRLTVGVMHRVDQIADRLEGELGLTKEDGWIKTKKFNRPGYKRIVPLLEVVAEALGSSVSSQKTLAVFDDLINNFDSEISVLLDVPIEEITKLTSQRVAEGINKVRQEDIVIDPGFDGVYGIVKIWPETKKEAKMDPVKKVKPKTKQTDQLGLF